MDCTTRLRSSASNLGVERRVLGVEHPGTLMTMDNLASTYLQQGRMEEAEQLLSQVLESRKGVLGAEHPSILMTVQDLANAQRAS